MYGLDAGALEDAVRFGEIEWGLSQSRSSVDYAVVHGLSGARDAVVDPVVYLRDFFGFGDDGRGEVARDQAEQAFSGLVSLLQFGVSGESRKAWGEFVEGVRQVPGDFLRDPVYHTGGLLPG